MPLWLIPMAYTVASLIAGFAFPRLEQAYLVGYVQPISAAAAMSFYSAVASGMMALTSIVFAIAFLVVQFSAVAYSPRLVFMFANRPALFHTLGVFFATFIYALVALIWTDRGGSGTVPSFSFLIVICLLIASLLGFVRLIRSVSDLQIHSVLRLIGSCGREVIAKMFPQIDDNPGVDATLDLVSAPGPLTQTVVYSGEPWTIAALDIGALVRLAQNVNGTISFECGVGETLVEGTIFLRVHGAVDKLPERALRQAVHLSMSRTFDQDPKYAIRLLVDIAIRALSPAVNDPTTAVQALDQIEDLLRRLGRRQLNAGYARDGAGVIRVMFPVPTWQDYLELSFDEIRQFGAGSVQVLRRLRAVLVGLGESISEIERRDAVLRYLERLNLGVGRSGFDDQDQAVALEEDRQGLGLSRRPAGSQIP